MKGMKTKRAIFLLEPLVIIIPLMRTLFKSKWSGLPESNVVPGHKYTWQPQLDPNGSLHDFTQVTNQPPTTSSSVS